MLSTSTASHHKRATVYDGQTEPPLRRRALPDGMQHRCRRDLNASQHHSGKDTCEERHFQVREGPERPEVGRSSDASARTLAIDGQAFGSASRNPVSGPTRLPKKKGRKPGRNAQKPGCATAQTRLRNRLAPRNPVFGVTSTRRSRAARRLVLPQVNNTSPSRSKSGNPLRIMGFPSNFVRSAQRDPPSESSVRGMLFGLLVAPQLPSGATPVHGSRGRLPLLQLNSLGPEALEPMGAGISSGSTLLFQDSKAAMSRTAETQRELLEVNTREMALPKPKRGKKRSGGGGGFGAGSAPALSKAQQVQQAHLRNHVPRSTPASMNSSSQIPPVVGRRARYGHHGERWRLLRAWRDDGRVVAQAV